MVQSHDKYTTLTLSHMAKWINYLRTLLTISWCHTNKSICYTTLISERL